MIMEESDIVNDKIEEPNIVHDAIEIPNIVHDAIEIPNIVHDAIEIPNIVHDEIEIPNIVYDEMEVPNIVYDEMEESNILHDEMDESSAVMEKLGAFNEEVEASNTVNGETSEVEDLDMSESEEVPQSENIPLNIDCNARIVTKEVMSDTKDDCDMQFIERNSVCLLSPLSSDTALHTSTEDLNMSDEEQSCVSALKSVNLDGLASTSSKKGKGPLTASNFSHTVFKDEFSFEAEYLSDEEIRCALQEKSDGEDKLSKLCPGLKLEGLLLTFRPPSSFFSPTSQDASDTCSVHNVSPNSMIDKSERQDLDDQESPSKTCFDVTKSEYSDDHNTDAEDISFGSLDDIIETSKIKNPFGKGYNAFSLPETLSCGNANDDRLSYSSDSRRSSAAGFLTEDETLTFENFSDCGKKKIKKFDFRANDQNDKSEESLTDEEVIEDQ